MDDKSWDKSVVGRSCIVNRPNNVVAPNLGLKSRAFENHDGNSLDRLLGVERTGFDGLTEIFSRDFVVAHQKNPDDQYLKIINYTNDIPMIADQTSIMDQNDNQQMLQPIPHPTQFSQQIFLPPPLAALVCVPVAAPVPQELIDPRQEFMMQDNVYPTFTFPVRSPVIQTCGRKNQEIKFIYELRQEELTDDTWRWRKYGQKSVKSSSFPRNYYKCSTSKACKARKQIEKILKDDNLFLVAYTGVHNHPPPTNRRPLASWNACFKLKLPKGINIVPRALSLNLSSKRSKCSHVTTTVTKNKGIDTKEEIVVTIPNKFVNEDILKGFEELSGVTSSI